MTSRSTLDIYLRLSGIFTVVFETRNAGSRDRRNAFSLNKGEWVT
jgi:hypothetical protein